MIYRVIAIVMLLCLPIVAMADDASTQPGADVAQQLENARIEIRKALASQKEAGNALQVSDAALATATKAHQSFVVKLPPAGPIPTPTIPPITTIQVTPTPPPATIVPIDLTNILNTIITGIFGIMTILLSIVINKYVKDKSAAAVLANAVVNSLGAAEQAAKGIVVSVGPKVTLPAGVPAALLPQLQYVVDHAGEEATRLGITPTAIASKIVAQQGLVADAQAKAVALVVATPATIVANSVAPSIPLHSPMRTNRDTPVTPPTVGTVMT